MTGKPEMIRWIEEEEKRQMKNALRSMAKLTPLAQGDHYVNDRLVGQAGIDYFNGGGGDDLILADGAAGALADESYLTQNNLLTGIQTTLDADGFMTYTYDQPDKVSVGDG